MDNMTYNSNYYNEDYIPQTESIEFGCKFCWDNKKKQDKILTFFDQANNLRCCNYCPWCGRKYLS